MKNSQKGSIIPVLIIVIILLIVAGGIYVYENQKAMSTAGINISTQPLVGNQQSATQTSPAAMQQYSDPEIGFSFWHPGNWQVLRMSPDPGNYDSNITEGTVLASLMISSNPDADGNTEPQIYIQEVHSPEAVITDSYGTGNNPTYLFNFSTHTWMTAGSDYNNYPIATANTVAADVSNNTMGGLHMLGGTYEDNSGGNAIIIPLSAQDFLVVTEIGNSSAVPLARTIMALDPAVATPVSASEQTRTVQNESVAYNLVPVGITWKTYTDEQTGISLNYPSDFGNRWIRLQESSGEPLSVLITPTGANIDGNGCYQGTETTSAISGEYGADAQVTLNGMAFCLSKGSDVGAGQAYQSYYYTTKRNGEYITIGYVVHTPNGCGAVEGSPVYLSCEQSIGNSKIVPQAIQKSVGTLRFMN